MQPPDWNYDESLDIEDRRDSFIEERKEEILENMEFSLEEIGDAIFMEHLLIDEIESEISRLARAIEEKDASEVGYIILRIVFDDLVKRAQFKAETEAENKCFK